MIKGNRLHVDADAIMDAVESKKPLPPIEAEELTEENLEKLGLKDYNLDWWDLPDEEQVEHFVLNKSIASYSKKGIETARGYLSHLEKLLRDKGIAIDVHERSVPGYCYRIIGLKEDHSKAR